jgi:hypothetical protein
MVLLVWDKGSFFFSSLWDWRVWHLNHALVLFIFFFFVFQIGSLAFSYIDLRLWSSYLCLPK